jgi:hypothetical protein
MIYSGVAGHYFSNFQIFAFPGIDVGCINEAAHEN